MEKRNPEKTISYFLHEGIMVRIERCYKWAIIALCVVMVLLIGFGLVESLLRYKENQAWLDYIAQYDFTDYDYAQDGRGINIIGNMNGVTGNVPETSNVPEVENPNPDEEESQFGEGTSNP